MKKEKELYTAPALRLLPLQLETGLCVSNENMGVDFYNPFDDTETNL